MNDDILIFTRTGPIPPPIRIPRGFPLEIQPEIRKEEDKKYFRDEACPDCLSTGKQLAPDTDRPKLRTCSSCHGHGRRKGIIRISLVEAPDGPQTAELIKLFGVPRGRNPKVRIYSEVMAEPFADSSEGHVRLWTELDGRFPRNGSRLTGHVRSATLVRVDFTQKEQIEGSVKVFVAELGIISDFEICKFVGSGPQDFKFTFGDNGKELLGLWNMDLDHILDKVVTEGTRMLGGGTKKEPSSEG